MRKVLCVMVLGLLVQFIPVRSFASYPSNSGLVPMAAAVGVIDLLSGPASKKSAFKGKNEIEALNHNQQFASLLKQAAGGSQTTLDILK